MGEGEDTMFDSRIERFYATIPETQKEVLRDFDLSHPQKILDVNGVVWSYFDSATDGEVLLLLHGGYADFKMWIHQIMAFEGEYRVIAPTCPALPDATMKAYSQALYAILKEERVSKLHMMGYSEGGLIAQCFLRDHPAMVDKVILAHTFYPSSQSRYARGGFRIFKIMPAFLTEWLFRTLARPDEEELQSDLSEWLAWFKGYFKELKHNLTKGTIITHIELMKDFVKNYHFEPGDVSDWDGDMLITVSADDVVLEYFDGLKRLYPRAEHHMFPRGLGAHSIALISPGVFNRRIRAFLE